MREDPQYCKRVLELHQNSTRRPTHPRVSSPLTLPPLPPPAPLPFLSHPSAGRPPPSLSPTPPSSSLLSLTPAPSLPLSPAPPSPYLRWPYRAAGPPPSPLHWPPGQIRGWGACGGVRQRRIGEGTPQRPSAGAAPWLRRRLRPAVYPAPPSPPLCPHALWAPAARMASRGTAGAFFGGSTARRQPPTALSPPPSCRVRRSSLVQATYLLTPPATSLVADLRSP